MAVQARIEEVTERIRGAAATAAPPTSSACPRGRCGAPPGRARLRQPRPRLRRLPAGDKALLAGESMPNLAIVTAYNDMLSAHQPYERLPDADQARRRARRAASAQVAGGVPAMCDGVTQGAGGHGAVAVLARRHRACRRRSRSPTTCSTPPLYLGICDKIVPGLLIGGAGLRPPAGASSCPAGPMPSGCPTTRRPQVRQLYADGQGRPRRAAGRRGGVLPRPRHLHLLRHRQHQPDADGDHGPAPARRLASSTPNTPLRDALTAAARSGRWRSPRSATTTRRSASWSTSGPSSTASSACTPPAARPTTPSTSSRWRRGGRHRADLGRFRRPLRRGAAAGAHLSERRRRREPLPRRRRHGLPDRRAARRRPAASRRAHGRRGDGLGALPRSSRSSTPTASSRWEPGRRGVARRRRAAPARPSRSSRPAACSVLAGNLGRAVIKVSAVDAGAARRSRRRRASSTARTSCMAAFKARRARPRLRRRGPLPGPARQRHAGAAQADPAAGRAAGPRPQGGAGHRRPHVGRLGQGAGGDPLSRPRRRRRRRSARLRDGDLIRLDAGRRCRRRRWRRAGGMGGRRRAAADLARNDTAPGASCSPPSAPLVGAGRRRRLAVLGRRRANEVAGMELTVDALILGPAPVIPVLVLDDVAPRRAACPRPGRRRAARARGHAADAGGARRRSAPIAAAVRGRRRRAPAPC